MKKVMIFTELLVLFLIIGSSMTMAYTGFTVTVSGTYDSKQVVNNKQFRMNICMKSTRLTKDKHIHLATASFFQGAMNC